VRCLVFLGSLCLLAVSLAAGPPAPSVPRVADDPVIGADCADCHPAVVASYARSGMARALGPLVPGELDGLAPVEDAAAGLAYRLEESAGSGWLVESWRDRETGEERRRSAPLGFAIGAGILDRSFAARRGGLSWFAPLEVLSTHGGRRRRAALAPGHMMVPGTRLGTPITEECLACHTDALPPRDYPLNLIPTDWTPHGISCAACHADAAAHTVWRRADLEGEEVDGADPILDHSALGVEERLSICARCHLQGDARIALRPGERGIPPPGGDLLERMAIFLPPEPDDDVAFVSQTERTVLSPCYLASRGSSRPLTCEVCHDPHVSVFEPAERARTRAACGKCHPPGRGSATAAPCSLPREHHEGADCASCHMRLTPVFDVAEVAIHDHFIRRRPPPPSTFEGLRVKHTTDGRLAPFAWPGTDAGAVAEDGGLAMMAAAVAGFPAVAGEAVDAGPGPLSRRLPSYYHLQGIVLEGAGRLEDARKAYRRALVLDPSLPESRMNLALLRARLGRTTEAAADLEALIADHPRAEGAHRNLALVRLRAGDGEGFARALEAAQRLLPRVENAHALADYYRHSGAEAAALRWDEEARTLGP
jgi:predicted CXXCH cytochrome family protein